MPNTLVRKQEKVREQFHSKRLRFCVKVEYNNAVKNSAEKMIHSLERHTVEHENQFVSGLPGMTAHAIKLTPDKSYNWHFDNCNWNFSQKKIVFTEHKEVGLTLFILLKVLLLN